MKYLETLNSLHLGSFFADQPAGHTGNLFFTFFPITAWAVNKYGIKFRNLYID